MSEIRSNHQDGEEMAAVHWEFDTDQEEPSIDVAEVIAELDGKGDTELTPIYETINQMIDTLFSDPPSAEAQTVLQFTYEGYRITLNQDGYATFMKVSADE